MKNLLLLFTFIFGLQVLATAQPCTPDPAIGGEYMYPPVLPFAKVRTYYHNALTFRVPKDTTIVYQGNTIPATVLSAQVILIKGIPAGYNYECNTPTCTWAGGTIGCAAFYGQNDNDTIMGNHPITIYIMTNVLVAGNIVNRIDSSSNYTFKVLAYNGGFEITKAEPLKVYPNPTNDILNIEVDNSNANMQQIEVADMTGKIIYSKTINKELNNTTEQVDLSAYSKGLYVVKLQSDQSIYTSRVLVK